MRILTVIAAVLLTCAAASSKMKTEKQPSLCKKAGEKQPKPSEEPTLYDLFLKELEELERLETPELPRKEEPEDFFQILTFAHDKPILADVGKTGYEEGDALIMSNELDGVNTEGEEVGLSGCVIA